MGGAKTAEQNRAGFQKFYDNPINRYRYLKAKTMTRIDNKDISRVQREIKRELRIRTPLQRPQDYITSFANKLQLGPEVVQSAKALCDLAESKDMTHGKSPTGVAAAVLYISTNMVGTPRTQREIAEISDVTEVTIRNRYKELVRSLELDFSV